MSFVLKLIVYIFFQLCHDFANCMFSEFVCSSLYLHQRIGELFWSNCFRISYVRLFVCRRLITIRLLPQNHKFCSRGPDEMKKYFKSTSKSEIVTFRIAVYKFTRYHRNVFAMGSFTFPNDSRFKMSPSHLIGRDMFDFSPELLHVRSPDLSEIIIEDGYADIPRQYFVE